MATSQRRRPNCPFRTIASRGQYDEVCRRMVLIRRRVEQRRLSDPEVTSLGVFLVLPLRLDGGLVRRPAVALLEVPGGLRPSPLLPILAEIKEKRERAH